MPRANADRILEGNLRRRRKPGGIAGVKNSAEKSLFSSSMRVW
jgi:hypothetical protein